MDHSNTPFQSFGGGPPKKPSIFDLFNSLGGDGPVRAPRLKPGAMDATLDIDDPTINKTRGHGDFCFWKEPPGEGWVDEDGDSEMSGYWYR